MNSVMSKLLRNPVADYTVFGVLYLIDRFFWYFMRNNYYRIYRSLSYTSVASMYQHIKFHFMSAGYEPLTKADVCNLSVVVAENDTTWPAILKPHFYMYEKMLSFVPQYPNLSNFRLIEVGCGQGGGLSWIKSAHPELSTLRGVDICVHDSLDGMIQQGDAHQLPYADQSADIVLNVESSHQYSNRPQFYSEVFRVLKPGGWFCYTDVMHAEKVSTNHLHCVEHYEQLYHSLTSIGFVEHDFVDISKEVLAGSQITSERYVKLMEDAPAHLWLLRRNMKLMIKSSYDEIADGDVIYFASCWQKQK